ncbi:peptidoglycan-binding domain-containing protein [Mycobacteroides abscessus]|uniref:peptidoglycan-binding domain-containing protein n=1 Tax=Mycobacteroides abscessus TaxID=36809 RepID=UPI0013F5BCB8|nr:peptidoglycan-binding domain-containing protein [Mycobacteroides abscessus]
MKQFLNRKFAWVRTHQPPLNDSPLYDDAMVSVVAEMQTRYGLAKTGIMDYRTQLECGYTLPASAAMPVLFTVEGHMSDMFIGPCAFTAAQLEQEHLCHWQPIGYNNTTLPFDNQSGIDELDRLFSRTALDNGVPFPTGTPWFLSIFSQGAIVGCEFMMRHVFPANGKHHDRLSDFRGCIAHGNPYRQNNISAEWVPDPPRPHTQGISNMRMTNTPTAIWKEVSRHGDLYAENTVDDTGADKTAIYMAVQNEWTGDPNALLPRLIALIDRPVPETIAMLQALISGVMFLGNMDPHGQYDLTPGINFARTQLTTAPTPRLL